MLLLLNVFCSLYSHSDFDFYFTAAAVVPYGGLKCLPSRNSRCKLFIISVLQDQRIYSEKLRIFYCFINLFRVIFFLNHLDPFLCLSVDESTVYLKLRITVCFSLI